jgi:hydroxymethylpyrimidine/phosphomethylpyrimidine kinase
MGRRPSSAVLEDMPVAAFKIGFVGSIENIAAIAEVVSDYRKFRSFSIRCLPPAAVMSSRPMK